MQFLDVKTDFAFKKVFGSPASKDILISFLNAVLDFGGNPIVDLTIVNPYQMPMLVGLKDTYVDIKAKLKNGEMVIIEMQVLNQAGFGKRILSNWAKAYATQLDKGDEYYNLKQVIALTITDFTLFDYTELESVVMTYFGVLEKKHKLPYLIDDFELVFVELPKFEKTESQLSSITDKWLYFLKHAGDLKSIPQILGSEQAIKHALSIANTASLTVEENDVQENKLKWIADQKANIVHMLQTEAEKQAALKKAESAEKEKQAALAEKQAALAEKSAALAEKQAALEKAENAEKSALEKQAALEKAENAEKAALEKAENAEKSTHLQMAKKMLQANVDIALIQQVTGLDEVSIKKLA
ncbi:MAG: Rpn family recombination-promoting nuclease/putative transposase [Pseudomonadota bacterium]